MQMHNPPQLKAALNRGPVTAAIDQEVLFLLTRTVMPKGYIVDERVPCSKSNLAVLVLLVGYDEQSYIVKGSWGTDIGDEGYFRIKMGGGGSGVCGILARNTYPIF